MDHAPEQAPQDPFRWKEDGIGLRVETDTTAEVASHVLLEAEFIHLKTKPFFVVSGLTPQRYRRVAWLMGLIVFVLLGRAFWMQIVDGASYLLRAEQNRLRHEVVPAKRGLVRARLGQILADNVPSFDVRLVPRLLPAALETRDEILGQIGRMLGLGLSDMRQLVIDTTDPLEALTLARDIPYNQAVAIQVALGDEAAIQVIQTSKRHYPEAVVTPSLSHILGYIGPISVEELQRDSERTYGQTDVLGKTGVEATYETRLRGKHGERVFEVNALNRPTNIVREREPTAGSDVVLTIDLDLQRAAEAALRRQLVRARLKRGASVVLNPQDGSILALVSWPAYDNNLFSGTVSSTAYTALLHDEDKPLVARAWSGVYPSGSTIKPVFAAAALSDHVITPHTTILSVGGIRIGQRFFPDWKPGGHGPTNVRQAIAWSVNSFFYTIGGGRDTFVGLGVDRLAAWLYKFGFGVKTGLDLPGESRGFVPSKTWKEKVKRERWYVGDTYNLSIGQGDLLVTPMQIAAATAAIANGGKRVQPHVVQNIKPVSDDFGTPIAVDSNAIKTVRLGMRDAVLYGSGRVLASFPVPVSGKTGTAQWRSDRSTHAWFTAFAPFEHPKIVVTVILEEGGEGSAVAVPVAQEILQAWYRQTK